MSDVFNKIKAGTDNVKTIDWPFAKEPFKVGLKIVSAQVENQALLDTEVILKDYKVELHALNFSKMGEMQSEEIIANSLIDLETDRKLFHTTLKYRETVSKEIHAKLLDEYDEFAEECAPNLDGMNEEEFEELKDELLKKPNEALGRVSSLDVAKKLLLTLVNPVKN
jgi:hypothetical protein